MLIRRRRFKPGERNGVKPELRIRGQSNGCWRRRSKAGALTGLKYWLDERAQSETTSGEAAPHSVTCRRSEKPPFFFYLCRMHLDHTRGLRRSTHQSHHTEHSAISSPNREVGVESSAWVVSIWFTQGFIQPSIVKAPAKITASLGPKTPSRGELHLANTRKYPKTAEHGSASASLLGCTLIKHFGNDNRY